MRITMLQSLDPTSYATSWGVLGALVFVIVLMGAVIYQIVSKGQLHSKERDQILIGFVESHQQKSHEALTRVASTIAISHKEDSMAVVKALNDLGKDQRQMFRIMDEHLFSTKFIDRVRDVKQSGVDLTDAELDRITSAIMRHRNLDATRGGGG